MLGKREPGIYGAKTLADIESRLPQGRRRARPRRSISASRTTRAILVDWIQEAGDKAAGIVINPGAYSHTSIAIHDAIRAVAPCRWPRSISPTFMRARPFATIPWFRRSRSGVICGFGPLGYTLALQAIAARL